MEGAAGGAGLSSVAGAGGVSVFSAGAGVVAFGFASPQADRIKREHNATPQKTVTILFMRDKR